MFWQKIGNSVSDRRFRDRRKSVPLGVVVLNLIDIAVVMEHLPNNNIKIYILLIYI